jgi:hypothetical protein
MIMPAAHGLLEAAETSFHLTRAALEPSFARAERAGQLTVKLQKIGVTPPDTTVRLVLPDGVTATDPLTRKVSNWKESEIRSFTWQVTASSPMNGHAQVIVGRVSKPEGTFRIPVRWHESIPITPADYVPAPAPVDTGPYLVGAIHCPLWEGGHRWRSIVPYPDREPVLGWYDEGDPEVTDWEIKWATDHGISFFLVCWYRAKGNTGQPVKPALDHWLHRGLAQSRYGGSTKFAIIFENGNKHFAGQTSETDLLENLLPFWIQNYFNRSNYLVLDGRPVLSIYNVERFSHDLGGDSAAGNVISRMRAACIRAGFKGLHLIGQYCWGSPPELRVQAERIQRIGMDASWSYHWPTFTGVFGGDLNPPATKVIGAQENLWRSLPQPNVLTLSMGWDSAPWSFAQTRIQWRLTPEEFRLLCQRAKTLLDERQSGGLASRLVLLDNWNEYGEGHYILPTREHGFDYLEAVRAVFAPHAAPTAPIVPSDIGRGPYDSEYRASEKDSQENK